MAEVAIKFGNLILLALRLSLGARRWGDEAASVAGRKALDPRGRDQEAASEARGEAWSSRPKQGFSDWPTDASGMRRQLSPAADIASDRLW
jgi:hypothetical protein